MALSDIDKSPLYIDSTNGRVGIGTSSPNEALTIEAPLSGDTGLAINYNGDNKAGITVNPTTGQIQVGAHPDLTSANAYYLSFNTASSNTVYERMRINSSGNVGIGSSTPSFRLAVEDGSGATRVNVRNNANAAAGSGIYFEVLNGGSTVGNGTIATQSNGDMAFFTGTSSGAERMRIDSSGVVGIGTNSPSGAKLEIFTASTAVDGLKISRYTPGNYYSTLRQDNHGLAIHVGTGGTVSERVAITPNGITFNGDTAAANALDDYEEGTWTVQERHGQATITTNRANYTKIGRLVYASASVNISSTNTNNLNLTLPFVSSISSYYAGNGSAGYHSLNSTYADNLRPVVENGADNIMFYYGTGSLVPCNGASGTRIDFTVMYMT